MIIFIFLGAHGVLRLGSNRSGQPNSSAGVKRPPDSNFPWRADFTDGRFNRKARNGKAEGESVELRLQTSKPPTGKRCVLLTLGHKFWCWWKTDNSFHCLAALWMQDFCLDNTQIWALGKHRYAAIDK